MFHAVRPAFSDDTHGVVEESVEEADSGGVLG